MFMSRGMAEGNDVSNEEDEVDRYDRVSREEAFFIPRQIPTFLTQKHACAHANKPHIIYHNILMNTQRITSHSAWKTCNLRCKAYKEQDARREWSACLIGCVASKRQSMSHKVRRMVFCPVVCGKTV